MVSNTLRAAAGNAQHTVRTDVKAHLKTTARDHLFKTITPADQPKEGESEAVVMDALVPKGGPSTPPPAPSSTDTPAMGVREFEMGDYLEPGDIILMTRLGSFFAWLLKFFDKSDFAHTAMVFQTPRQTDGIDQTFLIETSMSGVEIVSLSQFLQPTKLYADTGFPPDFVVGVKRLEAEWAGAPHRRMAASRMLHFIENEGYNFRLLAALASPRTRNLYFKVRDSLRGKAPAIGEFLRTNKQYMPSEFICSGFVQYAYIDMVRTAMQRGLIERSEAERALEDVIFVPNATMSSEIEELMACTPNFLANTQKLQWKYLIHGGEVFHVSTEEEVATFFRDKLPGRVKNREVA